MSKTELERLAVLEEQVREMAADRKREQEQLATIDKSLQKILEEMSRYKGFIGAIVFLIAAVGTFLRSWPLIQSFFNWITNKHT